MSVSRAQQARHAALRLPALLAVLAVALLAGIGSGSAASAAPAVPRFDHIVVVVMENHSYSEIIGSSSAPYINSLARQGTLLTSSYGVTHPSEPNYLALFSGSTQGLTNDSCPHTYRTANLAVSVRAGGLSFAGYSESMPSTGYTGCNSGNYARRHNPWVNFPAVPASLNRTFTAFPRTNYALLPTVSFVVPNLVHDMHSGSVTAGDSWLRSNLGGYVTWARTHNSLLILTWDEDDHSSANRIPTIFVGAHALAVQYAGRVNHYRVLRTIEAAYGLPAIGASASQSPITGVWS